VAFAQDRVSGLAKINQNLEDAFATHYQYWIAGQIADRHED
jgi:hypothetical protein